MLSENGVQRSLSVLIILDHIARYRPNSMVCWYVTLVSPAKTAEPIEMAFALLTWVGTGNHVLDWAQIAPWEGAILRGKGRPTVKCRDICGHLCCLDCGLGLAQGIMN